MSAASDPSRGGEVTFAVGPGITGWGFACAFVAFVQF